MFAPIARHKNLEFQFENNIEPNTLLNSDKLKIRQILTNLISNGIKYTLEGSVSFKARLGRSLVVFDIIDTGVGIPEDKLEEVFKPFVRIETYNQFAEGSGYGMSVVKGLVDLLGGEIHTESEVGKGSHFEVRIPVEVLEQQVEDKGEDTDSRKSLNILVIDDDNTLLSVIDNMLHRLGHQAIPCRSMNDLDNALQQIQEYDYILTDREMGAVSGNDILFLEERGVLKTLPESLRKMAELRLQYPDTPLRELGELAVPPIGKSGVNHRLRRLSEIAQKYRTDSLEET